jgi:hypothetical protein
MLKFYWTEQIWNYSSICSWQPYIILLILDQQEPALFSQMYLDLRSNLPNSRCMTNLVRLRFPGARDCFKLFQLKYSGSNGKNLF